MLIEQQLTDIARRYGIPVSHSWRAHWTGATSNVYPVGDVVIKVAFETADAISAVSIDAAMNPVVRELGVTTPELLAFDDTRETVPVPFAVYRRVKDAVPLHDLSHSAGDTRSAWETVGRNLARVHAVPDGTSMPVDLRSFRQTPSVDPRPWVEDLVEHGFLSAPDANWLYRLLDFLAPHALEDVPLRLCHGDLNGSNVLVRPTPDGTCTLIDWAGAGWLDPVWDFAAVPFAVVPWMLAGHRKVAPLPHDDTAEARICWCQMQTRLLGASSRMDRPSTMTELARDVIGIRDYAAAQGWDFVE